MIRILVTLAIVGFLLWLIFTYVPMPPIFHTIIIVAVVIVAIVYGIRFLNSKGMGPEL